MSVEEYARWSGLLVTVWGALLAGPAFHQSVRQWLGRIWAALCARFPRRRRDVRLVGEAALALNVAMAGRLTVGHGPKPKGVAAQVDWLAGRATELERRISESDQRIDANHKQLTSALAKQRAALSEELAQLRADVRVIRAENEAVDRRAVPVVAVGALLSGGSADLQHLPGVLGYLLISLVLAATIVLAGLRPMILRRRS